MPKPCQLAKQTYLLTNCHNLTILQPHNFKISKQKRTAHPTIVLASLNVNTPSITPAHAYAFTPSGNSALNGRISVLHLADEMLRVIVCLEAIGQINGSLSSLNADVIIMLQSQY